MYYFNCDYNEGCHPRILEKLVQTNLEQTAGYGNDHYCKQAADLIRSACEAPEADIHFLVGGTQTNALVISAALRPHQGVLCADTGHINVHETGAVEASGHKVLALPSCDGKITAEQVENAIRSHREDSSFEHMVQPGMVYLSQPTEYGTLYTHAELTAISQVCRRSRIFLFVDGARMGYGLAAKGNDVFLHDLAELCDVFYLGGTKLGALFGEAVVLTAPALQSDFRYLIKQRGGMLAKGRLLGLQFLGLMEDNTYYQVGAHAIRLADQIRDTLNELGADWLVRNTTNQLFPILPNTVLAQLSSRFRYEPMGRVDEHRSAVRFCTSWATTDEAVEALCTALRDSMKP